MNEKLLAFIENSFLSELLQNSDVTDISYNGVDLYYQHNKLGRNKAQIALTNKDANDFLRQIANLSEKQFSFTVPILDISIGRYRLNAVHSSISRVENNKSVSFSIRIASLSSRIKGDANFMDEEVDALLKQLLASNQSIVIGGPTGSGKTELQKYLLSSLPANSRVIVIDNLQELEFVRASDNLDLTSWQVSDHNNYATFEQLIRNALRSNPDWLIVSEARGKEMKHVLNSVMTGHPIITTMHAKTVTSMPNRIVRMIKSDDESESYDDIYEDLISHISFYVFVNKTKDENGAIVRFVESIMQINDKNEYRLLFKKEKSTDNKIEGLSVIKKGAKK